MAWHKTDHRAAALLSVDGAIIDGNFKVDMTDAAQLKWQAVCQHTSQMGKDNMKYTGSEQSRAVFCPGDGHFQGTDR